MIKKYIDGEFNIQVQNIHQMISYRSKWNLGANPRRLMIILLIKAFHMYDLNQKYFINSQEIEIQYEIYINI